MSSSAQIKSLLIVVSLFLNSAVLAQFDQESVLEPVLGDNSNGRVSYGYWYANWSPDFSYTEEGSATIDIDPALLMQTSFSMNIGGTSNILVQYVADQIFDEFDVTAKDQLGEDNVTTAKEILGQVRHKFSDDLIVRGRLTVGEFNAVAIPNDAGVNSVLGGRNTSENSYFKDVGVIAWESEYQEVELNVIMPTFTEDNGDYGGLFAGIRFWNYSRPIGLTFYPDEPPFPDEPVPQSFFKWVILSDYQSPYLQVGYEVTTTADEGFFIDGFAAIGYGLGSVESDYLDSMSSNAYYFDGSFKAGYEFLNLGYAGGRIFLGYRFIYSIIEGGDIVDGSSKISTKRETGGVPKDVQGEYYFSTADLFHGPIFGAELRF